MECNCSSLHCRQAGCTERETTYCVILAQVTLQLTSPPCAREGFAATPTRPVISPCLFARCTQTTSSFTTNMQKKKKRKKRERRTTLIRCCPGTCCSQTGLIKRGKSCRRMVLTKRKVVYFADTLKVSSAS